MERDNVFLTAAFCYYPLSKLPEHYPGQETHGQLVTGCSVGLGIRVLVTMAGIGSFGDRAASTSHPDGQVFLYHWAL
jgi:hypothetical protein